MKVLIVSTSDINGGAARAGYRLHQSLLANSIDSQMLVQTKSSDDYTVDSVSQSRVQKIISRLRPSLDNLPVRRYKAKTKTLFSPAMLGFSSIVDRINKINPDIVHIHWICSGMIPITDLAKINAPIVWNLHDMWAFTGGCHYDNHCEGYKNKCGNCPVLQSKKENDLSRKVHELKSKTYAMMNHLTVVGSSQWITKCAKESTLLKDKRFVTLPNCINTDLFKAIDQNVARDVFGIPKNKKVILFGAMNALGDPRKGAKALFEAINLLDVDNAVFVIAGSSKPKESLNLKCPVYFIPPLSDEVSLALMYNVADVMIVPSLQENLANSVVESLSCAVPVVAFDVGGNKDMIDHKENGYLARVSDATDLAHGIEWVLSNKGAKGLAMNARAKVMSAFDAKVVSKQYIDLYKRVLGSV